MDTTIHEMLIAAEKELADMLRQRDELNLRIIQKQNQVGALKSLADRNALVAQNEGVPLIGLTEAIRSVLRLRNAPMTAGDVKNALDLLGFNFRGISNPSAAVHSTLKRLADTDELSIDGAKAYRLKSWLGHIKVDKDLLAAAVGRKKK